jgi:predicted acylesterase/phospholipase RssA
VTTTTLPKKAYNNTTARTDMNSDILSSPIKRNEKKIENVLILQGGGSIGAFGCGVFKAIANNSIKLDIIAGTSIGGVNAGIIAGSKDEKHPEQTLERFWLDLSEGFVDFVPMSLKSCLDRLLLIIISVIHQEIYLIMKKNITPLR